MFRHPRKCFSFLKAFEEGFQLFPADIALTDLRSNHRVLYKKSDTQAAVRLPQPEEVAERHKKQRRPLVE